MFALRPTLVQSMSSNPYDLCVANKITNGKQGTIAFYVDDNLASHMDDEVLSDWIKQIEIHTGKMTVTRGREHVFLGMIIKFNENGTANIGMKDHVQEAVDDFTEDLKRKVSTPAKKDLFTGNPESSPLVPRGSC